MLYWPVLQWVYSSHLHLVVIETTRTATKVLLRLPAIMNDNESIDPWDKLCYPQTHRTGCLNVYLQDVIEILQMYCMHRYAETYMYWKISERAYHVTL